MHGIIRMRKHNSWITILIILTLMFIWIHSMMPGSVSGSESGMVFALLDPVLRLILPDDIVTEHLVRKLAHFSEYWILGAEMLIYSSLRGRLRSDNGTLKLKILLNILLSGLAVAFIDETIQMFSGRGPMIADMWIDLAGFTVGAGILCLIDVFTLGSGTVN